MKFKHVVIDADPFIYSNGFAIEEWNADRTEKVLKPNHTIQNGYWNINAMFKRCLELGYDGTYTAFLTPPLIENFRLKIYEDYKAKRKDARRPLYYKELKEYLISSWKCKITIGQEADDACSILHCKLNKYFYDDCMDESVVCSIDKDFNNIPGFHYNPDKPEQGVYFVTELQALKNFYLQILTGDTSDDVPRIKKGWRQKKTEELICSALNEKELIDIVIKEIYTVLDVPETDAESFMIDRGRLVWLRRKENELWMPPIRLKTEG